MNMSDIFTLLDSFRARHGWRFRYTKRTWWVWDGQRWTHLDALIQMQQALSASAREVFPAMHKAVKQLEQAYQVRNMEMRLRQYLTSEDLPSNPFQDRIDSFDPPPNS